MKIVNRTDTTIAYELRGGPERMTLSECDLEPGEEEIWESPYRHTVDCHLIVRIDEAELRQDADQSAVIEVRGAAGDYSLAGI